MNIEKILFSIVDVNDNEVPVAGVAAAKENWAIFYPELENLIDQFIADPSELTDEQQSILFYGVFLIAELKYTPALSKCLQLFSQSDGYYSPLEEVFGDTITELLPTFFYNVASGQTQALSDYILANHEAMYCKGAAIEAIFAQFEMGEIELAVLEKYISCWFDTFVTHPTANTPFLLSVIASYCIDYQLDQFQAAFISIEHKELFDEEYLSLAELTSWDSSTPLKLVEQGQIQAEFNVVETFQSWLTAHVNDEKNMTQRQERHEHADDIDIAELINANGLLSNLLYDENTIIENSIPVNELPKIGRNEPCICGSGKKYKKCCLH